MQALFKKQIIPNLVLIVLCGDVTTIYRYMKNLILLLVTMLVCTVTTTAQTTFYGVTDGISRIDVQDLTSGVEYSFESSKVIVIPIDFGHDYFIAVRGKNNTKTFVLTQTDTDYLEDAFFDVVNCKSSILPVKIPVETTLALE